MAKCCTIGTGSGLAGVDSNVTVVPTVARLAETGVVTKSRLVAAHGPVRTRIVIAVRILNHALQTRVALGAVASVSLGLVNASASVEAGLRRALVNVNLAILASKTCWAEALWPVVDCCTETAVFANTFRANDSLTSSLVCGAGSQGLFGGVTFKALPLTTQGLEKVDRARSARCQSRVGISSRLAFLLAFSHALRPRLEGEGFLRAFGALLESIGRR